VPAKVINNCHLNQSAEKTEEALTEITSKYTKTRKMITIRHPIKQCGRLVELLLTWGQFLRMLQLTNHFQ